MRAVIATSLLLIAGHANAGEQLIIVQHDSTRAVTCWITPQGGISCLPDNQLGSLPQTATPASEAARASPASSPAKNSPMQASPLPQKKRFQL